MKSSSPSRKESGNRSPDEVEALVPIGVVGRPHGLRGEVRAKLLNPTSTVLLDARTVIIRRPTGDTGEYTIRSSRPQGHLLVLSLDGVRGRNEAEKLKGADICVPRSELPAAEEDEFYDFDLVGLEAIEDGATVGKVVAVDHPPTADVLTIKLGKGEYVDLPMVEGFVQTIDLEKRQVEVTLPPDLPTRRRP